MHEYEIKPKSSGFSSCLIVKFINKKGTENFIIIELRNGIIKIPGGKSYKGETPEETALREFQEETGLKINPTYVSKKTVFETEVEKHRRLHDFIVMEAILPNSPCMPKKNKDVDEDVKKVRVIDKKTIINNLKNMPENHTQAFYKYWNIDPQKYNESAVA